MDKRFLISVVVTTILLMMLGYLVHGVLLASDYAALPNLYRTADEQAKYAPLMLPAQLVAAIAMVWVFRRSGGKRGYLGEGIRFGIAIAALMTIPKFLIYYSIQPIPGSVVVKQIVFDTIALIVIGIVLAFLNRETAS